ncbi:MAG: hypothetical protein LBC71_05400 [Oscillospiraceae bacterium]|jgi:hypothetical protein|nr:hypothetical protein [Oscillospiraceae bacterium]
MSRKVKWILVICSLIALLIVAIILYNHFTAQRVIASDPSLKTAIRTMNNIHLGGFNGYELAYAKNGLIVAYNLKYSVVLQQDSDERWFVTHLLNPLPEQHYRFQGSTVSVVSVDRTENYIAIYSYDIYDEINDPVFIFDINLSELTEYKHGTFPDDIDFSVPENRINSLPIPSNISPKGAIYEGAGHHDIHSNIITFFDSNQNPVMEVSLKYEPATSIYLYDENTIVYMKKGISDSVGGYQLCFQYIDTEIITKLRIR